MAVGIRSKIELDRSPALASLSAYASKAKSEADKIAAQSKVVIGSLSAYAAKYSEATDRAIAKTKELAAAEAAAAQARRDQMKAAISERRKMNEAPTADVTLTRAIPGRVNAAGLTSAQAWNKSQRFMVAGNAAQDFADAGFRGVANNLGQILGPQLGGVGMAAYAAVELGPVIGEAVGNFLGDRLYPPLIEADSSFTEKFDRAAAAAKKVAEAHESAAGIISRSVSGFGKAASESASFNQFGADTRSLKREIANARVQNDPLATDEEKVRSEFAARKAQLEDNAATAEKSAREEKASAAEEVARRVKREKELKEEIDSLNEQLGPARLATAQARRAYEQDSGPGSQAYLEAKAKEEGDLEYKKKIAEGALIDAVEARRKFYEVEQDAAQKLVEAQRAHALAIQQQQLLEVQQAAELDKVRRKKAQAELDELTGGLKKKAGDLTAAAPAFLKSVMDREAALHDVEKTALGSKTDRKSQRDFAEMNRQDAISRRASDLEARGLTPEEARAAAENENPSKRRGRLSAAESAARRAGRRSKADRGGDVFDRSLGGGNFSKLDALQALQDDPARRRPVKEQKAGSHDPDQAVKELTAVMKPLASAISQLASKYKASPLTTNSPVA